MMTCDTKRTQKHKVMSPFAGRWWKEELARDLGHPKRRRTTYLGWNAEDDEGLVFSFCFSSFFSSFFLSSTCTFVLKKRKVKKSVTRHWFRWYCLLWEWRFLGRDSVARFPSGAFTELVQNDPGSHRYVQRLNDLRWVKRSSRGKRRRRRRRRSGRLRRRREGGSNFDALRAVLQDRGSQPSPFISQHHNRRFHQPQLSTRKGGFWQARSHNVPIRVQWILQNTNQKQGSIKTK